MPPALPACDPYADFSANLLAIAPVPLRPRLLAALARMMLDGPGLSLPPLARADYR